MWGLIMQRCAGIICFLGFAFGALADDSGLGYTFKPDQTNCYDITYGGTNEALACRLEIIRVDSPRERPDRQGDSSVMKLVLRYSDFSIKSDSKSGKEQADKARAMPLFQFEAEVDGFGTVKNADLSEKLAATGTNALSNSCFLQEIIAGTWLCLFPPVTIGRSSTMDRPVQRDWSGLKDAELAEYMGASSSGFCLRQTIKPKGHRNEILVWQSVREMEEAIKFGGVTDRVVDTSFEAWYDMRRRQITTSRMEIASSTVEGGVQQQSHAFGMTISLQAK